MPILLVIAPHPDDAVLAAGGVIQRAVRNRWQVHVWHVTHGDGFAMATWRARGNTRPIDFVRLGHLRRQEALVALLSLGVRPSQIQFAGGPDGALRPLLTRPVISPWTRNRYDWYPQSPLYRTPYHPQPWLSAWYRAIGRLNPTLVVLPDVHDANADHHAVALWGSHLASSQWRYVVHGHLPTPHIILTLTREEQQRKAQAIRFHPTQMAVTGPWLLRFAQSREQFVQVGKPPPGVGDLLG